MKTLTLTASLFAAALTALAAPAPTPKEPPKPTLTVGDPAPALQVSKWAQGEAVEKFVPGQAYIVEFWATWCGPCRYSIPHVNDLHQKYKDRGLTVIGQDVWERKIEGVAPFLKKMSDRMTYRIALDLVPEGEKTPGKMADTWMRASGQDGIPSAFLVDKKGLIAWVGHPMELKASMIEQVLAGTFDLKQSAAEHEKELAARSQLRALSGQLGLSLRSNDMAKAETVVDAMLKLESESGRNGLTPLRIKLLASKGQSQAAQKLAAEVSAATQDDGLLQMMIARELATNPDLKDLDLALTEKIANRANAITKSSEPAVLDLLARVNFMAGKKDQAIAFEEKAVNEAEGQMKPHLQKSLDSYKAGQLPK